MKEQQTTVAVVGAGLAGLAAAYELSKQEGVKVRLFEANDYVGGRVNSLPVNGLPVDFGGFIVYPWYAQFHRLLGELGIDDQITPIPLKDIYYDLDGDHNYRTEKQIDFPVGDTVRLYPSIGFGVLPQNDMAAPKLDAFEGRTIAEQFRKILNVKHETIYERYTDTISQGYCYGPVDKYKMAFVAPIIRFQRLYGDISKAFYFKEGTGVFTNAFKDAIEKNGGEVSLEAAVTKVDGGTLTVGGAEQTFDKIVFALTANDPIYTDLIPDVKPECEYTHFYTISIKASGIPEVAGTQEWGAVFHRPEAHVPYQVLSSINLASLYEEKLSGYINFNVVARNSLIGDEVLSGEELFAQLLPQLRVLFPDVEWQELVQIRHWTGTMPIAQEGFVKQVREAQGKNGHYFAGDYLGSPSMETALATGVRAADYVIKDLK